MPTMTLTRQHLNNIANSLNLRIWVQLGNLERITDFLPDELNETQLDAIKNLLNQIQKIAFGFEPSTNHYGINSSKVPLKTKISYDMYNEIKHFLWKSDPDPSPYHSASLWKNKVCPVVCSIPEIKIENDSEHKEVNLPPKQLEIFRYIENQIKKNNVSPSYEEIAKHMKVSKGTIQEHINALVKKGFLIKIQNKHRNLQIAERV